MHQLYGVDVDDRPMLRSRRWRWLRVRIEGLLSEPESRLWRMLNPEAAKEVGRGPHGR